MLITSELETLVADVAVSQAKISLAPRFVTTKEDDSEERKKVININYSNPYWVISKYFEYINYFNSITEFQTRIMDKELEEIQILNEFVPFITPRTVRYVPSLYWSNDLLKRTSSNGNACDYEEFVKLQNHIRRWFKREAQSELTSLATLKVHKSLADVLPYAAYKGKVSYDDKAFVPLEIYDACLGHLFAPDYFNTKVATVLTQFIAQMKF